MNPSALRAPTIGMGFLLVLLALFFVYRVWWDLSREEETRVAAPEQSAEEREWEAMALHPDSAAWYAPRAACASLPRQEGGEGKESSFVVGLRPGMDVARMRKSWEAEPSLRVIRTEGVSSLVVRGPDSLLLRLACYPGVREVRRDLAA